MAIDIFSIKPNVVTRDLRGKSFFIYGEKKSGKTSTASKFPKPIILAFEKGYGLIPGVIAQPINSWKEALQTKKQLLQDAERVQAHNEEVEKTGKGEKIDTHFTTVIVDTGDIAYDFCEKYILDKEGVEYLDETEAKRGYRALSREFDKFFQEIVKANYTLIVISHADSKQIKEKGEKYEKTVPTLPSRGALVVSRLVDITAYAEFETDPETGATNAYLIMRGSKFLEAGSRNKYTSTKIPFTYEALRDDMAQAIDKLVSEDGAQATNETINLFKDQTEEADFNDIMAEIKKYAWALKENDKLNEYNKIVAEYLGKGRNVKDCDESQLDIMVLILDELKDYTNKNNIVVK